MRPWFGGVGLLESVILVEHEEHQEPSLSGFEKPPMGNDSVIRPL